MNITNSALRNPDNFATSCRWIPEINRYVYTLELTEAESSEVSRLACYGYDCGLSDSCHDITWPEDGIVAYHFYENEANEVYEAYGDLDAALATCGMQSLLIKVQGFIESIV